MSLKKKVCIAFLGNALHDSRITNLSNSLREDGCKVSVIGFDWFITSENYFDDETKIIKLTKGSFSIFFYLEFAYTLLRELISTNADIYFAEDFYTLPFVTVIAKIKRAKIYYNSRELYAFIGGLRNRPKLQALITRIEKYFIKKTDLVLTTGEMDSDFLEKFYGITNTLVIRNIPLLQTPVFKVDFRKDFNLSSEKIILIYQGIFIEGRGIPLIIKAIAGLPKLVLVLIGEGEQKNNFMKLADDLKISNRVIFIGAVNQKELINYTGGGDIGLSLIENISISYYHALPNKLFEYIMAGLPVLCSDLPQMKKIVVDYKVGESINIETEENIYSALRRLSENPSAFEKYKHNCSSAAQELNWQKEYERVRLKLLDIQ